MEMSLIAKMNFRKKNHSYILHIHRPQQVNEKLWLRGYDPYGAIISTDHCQKTLVYK